MMFFGQVPLPLRKNYEFFLPPAHQKALGGTAFLIRGFDRNLVLLSGESFAALSARVRSTSISDPLSRMLRRMILGGAEEIAIADDGQVCLPMGLCHYAGLEQELILVGQGDYLELWAPQNWTKQLDDLTDPGLNGHRFGKFDLALARRADEADNQSARS
jgi:transcriptional regulator MraZ